MSGETEANVSGWTVDTLHTHLTRQVDLLRAEVLRHIETERRAIDIAFNAQSTAMSIALASADKAVLASLAAQKEAIAVAQASAEKRADIQNEWRSSLNDVLMRAMPRTEAEAIVTRSTERVTELNDRVTRVESVARGAQTNKAGIFAALGVATSLIIAIVVVINLVTSAT